MVSLLYRSGDGAWVSVPNTTYEDEEELRTLLVTDPSILALDEIPTVESTTRVTVGREAALGSGFADIIWVDLEGNLTILEVKLRSNPEIRREVLAQALSYAAFLEGMDTDDFVATIAQPYLESTHEEQIAAMPLPEAVAGISGADVDTTVFWEGLERSLARGDFTILVVVDEPHTQLRRSVSYVNSHADFELYLVEVGFYRSPDGTHEVLSPRILDAARTPPPPGGTPSQRYAWDIDSFLEQSRTRYPDNYEQMKRLVARLQELEREGTVELRFGTGQQSTIIVVLPDGETRCLWVRASGSVQMPRYKLRDYGYSDDEITAMMDRVAEVSGAPRAKYSVQQEPQIVLPGTFTDDTITERLVEVVNDLSADYRQQAAEE
jgi:hypothetical protein